MGYSVRPVPWLQIEADAFYSSAEDLIQLTASDVGRPGKPTAMNQFQNVAKAEFLGGELKLDAVLLRAGNVSAITFFNYSYQKNRYIDVPEGKTNFLSHDLGALGDYKSSTTMPRVSAHKANLGFTVYYGKEWVFTPVFHYVGERPNVITSPVEFVPSYHLINFSLTYRPLKSRWQSQLYVFNALNQEINDPGTRDAAGDYFSPLRPVEKLTIWFVLRYNI